VLALAAGGSACGDGGQPAAVASTLTPSAATSSVPAGTPSAGATTTGPAHPTTSPGVTGTSTPATPSATATPAKITDASIRFDVIKRLGASPTLVGLEIQVRVRHRVVYLFGTVTSRHEKAVAEHIALTEPGVVKVVSLIQVVPGGGY
jgi:hypothetical protein